MLPDCLVYIYYQMQSSDESKFLILLHSGDSAFESEQFTCTDSQLEQLGSHFEARRESESENESSAAIVLDLSKLPHWDWLVRSTGCNDRKQALQEARRFFEHTCLRVALPSHAAFPLHVYLAHAVGNAQVLARLWPPLDTVPMVNAGAFALLCRLVGVRSAAVQRRHATQQLMRRLGQCAPDVAYAVTHEFRYLHEYEKAILTLTNNTDSSAESSPLIRDARHLLAIDAHEFCQRPEPREFSQTYQPAATLQQFLVPPPCYAANAPWLLDMRTGQRRLKWATYGLLKDAHEWLFDGSSKIVLSGSLLPLCFLATVYKTDDRAHFVAYAEENYRARSVDLFIYGADAERTRELVLQRLERRNAGGAVGLLRCSHVRTPPLTIYEYVVQLAADDRSVRVQIVCMAEAREPVDTFLFHHLPLVRAGYTCGGGGHSQSQLLVTPMCLVSWRFRVCMGHVCFSLQKDLGADAEQWGSADNSVPPLNVRRHWSRLVLKWACRGFAFPPNANWGLPRTIRDWVHEAGPGPLPWYHPLYAPSSWSRFLSDEEVQACLECTGPL